MRKFVTAALCLLLPTAAAAQTRLVGSAPATIEPAARRAIIDSLASAVERLHTSPDTGRMIAETVRLAERLGRYAQLDRPALVEALTEDLRSVNGDRHLRVMATAPVIRAGPPPSPSETGDHGVARVEYLEDNVGYLKFTGPMYGSPETLDVVTRALHHLAGADALIIDVRGVPGGSAAQVNFLFSHFVPAATPEVRVVDRANDTDRIRYSLPSVPGPRRTDVPLYVLTDSKSASAAEALPFALQSAGRATIVGERTAGAGRNNTFVELGGGLWASITFTRVSDPRTGREFEGSGVIPDIVVPGSKALAVAHAQARERLNRGTAHMAEAASKPAAAPAADSAAIHSAALDYIEGWYEGDATRMQRALHPDLAKRIVQTPAGGRSRLGHMTADQLVDATAQGGGSATPMNRRLADVHILDVFGAAATVRIDAADWVDYLHVARTDSGWVIVNVLWELRGG